VIMVALFPYLVVRSAVSNVPTTVVNGRTAATGPLAEDDYLAAMLAKT
jgi:hypothetical protein